MLERFGKSIQGVLPFKGHFFEDNGRLLARVLSVADVYGRQPVRRLCKNCRQPLVGAAAAEAFGQHGVRYVFCSTCGHCCGDREETAEFLRFLYSDDKGAAYAATYDEADVKTYRDRVSALYAPKIAFLHDVLRDAGIDPLELQYADLGAGSGYLVAALRAAGVRGVQGYDVSEHQAALAERMLGNRPVVCHAVEAVADVVGDLEADVVSMVGFIEHVPDPAAILTTLRANRRVRYLLMTFPMFSSSVAIEHVFPGVFPRHLSGGHTHIYTLQSLAWLEREFGLRPLGKWWFGTDILDLYRSMAVTAAGRQDGLSEPRLRDLLFPLIDELQFVVDRSRQCSSVHAVYALER